MKLEVFHVTAEAARFGMAGSPTLLIDGIDGIEAFTAAGQWEFGVSCRRYRDPDGRIVSAPSIEQLRDAITAPARTSRRPRMY